MKQSFISSFGWPGSSGGGENGNNPLRMIIIISLAGIAIAALVMKEPEVTLTAVGAIMTLWETTKERNPPGRKP